MRFRAVNKFLGGTLGEVATWLKTELNSSLRELHIGLTSLTFGENFRSFEWEGSIEPGVEQQILHDLRATPTRFQVVAPVGSILIIKGDTAPTSEFFYVKNVGTLSTFTGKIILFP